MGCGGFLMLEYQKSSAAAPHARNALGRRSNKPCAQLDELSINRAQAKSKDLKRNHLHPRQRRHGELFVVKRLVAIF